MEKKCAQHPDAPSVADCKVCGTPVCLMCVEEVGESSFCSQGCSRGEKPAEKARAGRGSITHILKSKCHAHPQAQAAASCKVCQKTLCAICVIDTPDGEFCSEQCQQDLAAVDGWVTPDAGEGAEAGAESAPSAEEADDGVVSATSEQLLISNDESLLDMPTMKRPPRDVRPEPDADTLEEPAPYASAPKNVEPAEEEAEAAAEEEKPSYLSDPSVELSPEEAEAAPPPPLPPPPPPPVRPRTLRLVACAVCEKQMERSAAIETSDGQLFCSFECSGQAMGAEPPAEETPAERDEPAPETQAAAPKRGSKLAAVVMIVAALMLILVGLVAFQAFQTPAPAGASKAPDVAAAPPKNEPPAKTEPAEPKPPKPEPKPVVKAEPKPEPKPEPKAEPKPPPKPDPKPEPKTEPKPEPKPVVKAEPKPEPKAEPKPVPPPPKPMEDPGPRRRLQLAEAESALAQAEPLVKELLAAVDAPPDARRALEDKAGRALAALSRARDLYTASRDADPLALDRKISSIAETMEAISASR